MKLKTVLLAGTSLLAMTAHAHALEAIGSIVISAMMATPLAGLLPAASAATIGMTAIATVATAANLAMSFMGRRPKSNPQDIKNTSKGAEGPGRHAFGRVRLGGEIGFGNTSGYNLYRLLLHCFGPIVAIEEWYYDGRSITVDSNGAVSSPPWIYPGGTNLWVQWKPGNGAETAWPALVADFPGLWTADHRVRGIGQSLLRAVNPGTEDERFGRLFQGGVKELEALARVGLFYDPRSDSSVWTLNGVLIGLHYFRRLPGMRDDYIDFDAIGAIATQAEVLVPTLTGTAPRCQLSGGWKGPLSTDIVLDMMESAGLEVRITPEGKFMFGWLEDNPDSEMTYTTSHLLESYPQAGPEGVTRPNVCRLRYFAPTRNYEVAEIDLSDAPWARVQSEIDKYGEQEMVIDLVFCPDPSQAQRIARRMFHMARADFGLANINFAGITTRGLKSISIPLADLEDEPVKVRKGTARSADSEGRVEVPFQIIPEILKTPWDAGTMEVPPPPPMPDMQHQSELPTPSMPVASTLVIYPNDDPELRILFTGVAGGTVAEAAFRYYTGGLPEPWMPMAGVRISAPDVPAGEALWLGFYGSNLNGLDADFRVRFFDSEGEGSYWSPTLETRPVTIDNTPPDAPTLVRGDGNDVPDNQFRVTAGDALNVAYIQFWMADNPGGPWTVQTAVYARPRQVSDWVPLTFPPGTGWTRYVVATSYSSNGTPGGSSSVITVIGPPNP